MRFILKYEGFCINAPHLSSIKSFTKIFCMKPIVLKYGLLGGLIVSLVLCACTIYCANTGKFEGSMVLGYASMILAFSFIFVAVKHIRDKQDDGAISFGKAFKVAILITLVTSTVYVLVWLVCYYFFIPDFMEQYTSYTLNKAQAQGVSAAELSKQTEQMKEYADMYKNPLFVVLLTYMEILPVGLLVSLLAAFILKRKKDGMQGTDRFATA